MTIKKGNLQALPLLIIRTAKCLLCIVMCTVLIACTSMMSSTNAHNALEDAAVDRLDKQEHEALAAKFENMANEMQVKAEEQKELLRYKSYSSQFGKNRENTKSRIEYKIRQYEQAAADYRSKAASHTMMAIEQTARQSAELEKKGSGNMQLDKAKHFFDETETSKNTGKF